MIINASPLIIFGKLNKIDLLKKVLKKIVIAPQVYEEVVVRGLEIHASEASIIAEYIERGEIIIKEVSTLGQKKAMSLQKTYKLIDSGEAETIALALEEHESEILLDDLAARMIAKLHNLIPRGSLWVLLSAFEREIITEEEIKILLSSMVSFKFRISASVVAEFLSGIERIKMRHNKKR